MDLDGDSVPEFAAANHISPGFAYFPGQETNGVISFAPGLAVPFVPPGSNSAGIAAADFNNDGFYDIANTDHAGILSVRINGGSAGGSRFPPHGETDLEIGIDHANTFEFGFAGVEGGLIAADFNADGKPDIATANLSKAVPEGYHSSSIFINETPDGAIAAVFSPIVAAGRVSWDPASSR